MKKMTLVVGLVAVVAHGSLGTPKLASEGGSPAKAQAPRDAVAPLPSLAEPGIAR